MSKNKKNRSWDSVQVGMGEMDTTYLLGILSADIGALKAAGAYADGEKPEDVLLKRAYRLRQKIRDALTNRKGTHGIREDRNKAVAIHHPG